MRLKKKNQTFYCGISSKSSIYLETVIIEENGFNIITKLTVSSSSSISTLGFY